jgi:hypothetical protein
MSEQNDANIVETDVNDTNLDEFEVQFHGLTPDADDDQKSDGDDDTDDDGVDTQPAEDADPDDDAVATEDDEDGEEEGNEPEAKPKSRFQERIDQLNEKARKEKERADALEARLAKLEAAEQKGDTPPANTAKKDDQEPAPEDLNEDGTEKYPLGEYDPNYVRDLTRYTHRKMREEDQAEAAKTAANKEAEAAEAALEARWAEKLTPAQERYPDFREKGEDLLEVFTDLDPQYGKYLSSTLMGMEYGPDVLYYLANHLDVAEEIVALGPLGATLALGKIEAQFEGEPKVKRKVTAAKAPPPANKGSAVAKPAVAPDTDDLDAFAREFNGKR